MAGEGDKVDLGADFQATYAALKEKGPEALSKGLKAVTGVLEDDSTSGHAPPQPQVPKSEPTFIEGLLMSLFGADSKQDLMETLGNMVKKWLGSSGLGGVFNLASGSDTSEPRQAPSQDHQPPAGPSV